MDDVERQPHVAAGGCLPQKIVDLRLDLPDLEVVVGQDAHFRAVQTGDLVVNLDTKTVEVGGQRVHLTGKEYQMLELLSLRKGTTLTKEMFLNHLYGGMDEPELKIIDVFICKLRKKLANAAGGKNFIETVWGRGYVLRENAPAMGEEIRVSA